MSDVCDESFPRDRRVRHRRDYQRVQSARIRSSTASYVFTGELSESDAPTRMGLVVSRRVGNAVARNRTKRLCREVFRRHLQTSRGMTIVAIAKPGAAALSLEQTMSQWLEGVSALARKLHRGNKAP